MEPYSKSILAIHDDPEVVRCLSDVLGLHGCRVEQVTSSRSAYDDLLRAPLRPRMIIVDWAIPEREQFPFLEHKADSARLAPIPVVVLADLSLLRTLPTLGVRAVLAMPLRPHMITEAVIALSGLSTPVARAQLAS